MDNYNHLFLSGDKVWTDEKYCKDQGLDPSLAGTKEINNKFIEENPDRQAYLTKLYANSGLLT